jgi:3'-phosphoadenosine 5'-phosphosulfate sulfotransferase (PAPS reductase)/FAD synthetase
LTFTQQIEYGKIHAKLPGFQRKVDEANHAIAQILEIAPHSYLSISFGKDSTVMAVLVRKQCPKLPMYFLASDETWVLSNYAEVINQFCDQYPINLKIIQTNHIWNNDHQTWAQSRTKGDNDLRSFDSIEDWDGKFVGLTKEESKSRKISLATRKNQPADLHPLIFRYINDKYRCCPLANWTLQDIAAAIATWDIPVLDTYKTLGLAARTTARLTKLAATWGGLTALKQSNLATYQLLVARFPELRCHDVHQ